jgi:hypothetical protein
MPGPALAGMPWAQIQDHGCPAVVAPQRVAKEPFHEA